MPFGLEVFFGRLTADDPTWFDAWCDDSTTWRSVYVVLMGRTLVISRQRGARNSQAM